ncbi:VOC family protein [Aerococcaceae bacterium DSM 111176]|nr:VOC family protein [Aerococcaceae bacterium DSM 111176]
MAYDLVPYLVFGGNAKEAIEFYEGVFGAKAFVTHYGEWPQEFDNNVPEDIKDKVMHSELKTESFSLFFSDHFDSSIPYQVGNAVLLTLDVRTREEAEDLYNKLSDGGQTIMPFEATSYSSGFAQFTDKFGMNWQVIADMPEEEA